VDPQAAQVYGDLIKIGLPSAVALAGVVSSIVLAIKGYRKDIEIENLRNAREMERDKAGREGELVRSVTPQLTRLHDSLIKYGTLYAAYIETQDLGEEFPAKNRKELTVLYQSVTDSLHLGTEIQGAIFLLGEESLKGAFNEYWTSVSGFTHTHSPGDYAKYASITSAIRQIGDKHEALFAILSKIYLLKDT